MRRAASLASVSLLLWGAINPPRGGFTAPRHAITGPHPPDLGVVVELEPVRAALYLYYRGHALGEARITNHGTSVASGLRLRVELPGRRDLLAEAFLAEVPDLTAGGTARLAAP